MKKNKKAVNKILDVVSTVIIILLLICVLSNLQRNILGQKYNSFLGYSFFEVSTGSMSGTIEIGDWILVKVTQDVEYGDIVTYEKGDSIITHRIVETYGENIVTKGDANNSKDEPITRDAVIGKMVKVIPNFAIIKKTLLNEKVLILFFALVLVANSIFNQEFNKEITEKIKSKFTKKPKAKKESAAEKKIKETIEDAPVTSKTTLLSKVDVDFQKSMISKVKDAYDEDKQKEAEKNVTREADGIEVLDVEEKPEEDSSLNISMSEDAFTKIMNQIKSQEEESTEDLSVYESGNIEDLSLDAMSKKSKKEILKEFLDEADSLDNDREDEFAEDLEQITKRLGIDAKVEIGKQEKSITKKFFALKKSEIKRLFYIILGLEEDNAEYKSIINKYHEFYIDSLYYKLCDKEIAKNPLLSVSKMLANFNAELLSKISSNNKKKQINKVYLAANAILQIELSKYDEKVINKIFGSPRMEFENANDVKKAFLTEHKKYLEAYKLFIKRIDSKKLYIELNKIANYNLYTTKMNANIKFSKIFSEYIIDKTYNNTIIIEALKEVEIVQLTSEIVNDLMTFNAKRKYLLYLPETIYKKPKKLISMLKLIDDEYSQNKVYLLINEEIYKNYLEILGELKKLDYKIILESDIKQLQSYNHGRMGLYISNIVLIDKNKDISLDGINVDTLNKKNFIVLNESCIMGVDVK